MALTIEPFTEDRIEDVIAYERELREQEKDTYFWDIDEQYITNVKNSFKDSRFADNAITLLAYIDGRVIGRIDAALICSRFDGTISAAYLDWISVLKNERHAGVAQSMMTELRKILKEKGLEALLAVVAGNGEANKFYHSLEDTKIQDEAAWINL